MLLGNGGDTIDSGKHTDYHDPSILDERGSTMTDDIEKTLEDIEALFAQTAREVTSEGDKVILHGTSPATLYFSDRPQRVVGHLTTKKFVEEWGEGENSFAADPPNAVISFVEKGDRPPATPSSCSTRSSRATRSPTRWTCLKAACRPRANWSPCSSTPSGVRSRRSRWPA